MKHLLLSLALLLLPLGAWAQYDDLEESPYSLWVQGNAVTDDNKANILSEDVATVSYDSETNVLTLNSATVNGATYTKGCILSGRSSLTISIIGDNTIASSDTCTAIIAVGTGEQTLTIAKGNDGCTLSFNVSRCIRGFSSLTLTGLYWNGSYTYQYDTTLQEAENGYRLMQSDGVEAAKTVDPQTYQVESMPTLSDVQEFNLWIGDTAVTSANADNIFGDNFATAVYDATTSTLTLNNATISPEDERPGIVYAGTEDLTIMLIGTNRIQGGWGCEAIRCDVIDNAPKFIFTTNENEPGKLINTGEGDMFDPEAIVEYQNGLGMSTTAEGGTIALFQSYGLWVMGIHVTSVNKENILGDANASVRFNPQTGTLSLYGISLGFAEEADTIVSSSLPALTVDLHGNNIIRFRSAGFRSRNMAALATLTFITDTATPGQLSWDTTGGTITDGFSVTYLSPLELQPSGNLISATEVVNYDLSVGTTVVTSVNCTDVLGNGAVKYVDEAKALVLDNAYLDMPITSSLANGLTIYLLGDNTINGTESLVTSTVAGAPLTITSSDSKPGSLTLTKTEDTGTWISGFAAPSIPNDYATAANGNTMTIARPVPITPIVAETENGETPETEKSTEEFIWEAQDKAPDTYLNIVINNVLYTLKAGDCNEGTWDDPDDPSGVNLTEVPADMDDVLTKTPGSDAYADAFKGLTIEIPAGNGQVVLRGEIGANAKLAVQIGNNAPTLFPNEEYPFTNTLEALYVPYSCSEPTFVYIYLAGITPSAPARSEGPVRGRVLVGHIKISNVGASSSMIVSDNSYSAQTNAISDRVIVYDLPASATAPDNRGIVLSTVGVEQATYPSRGVRRALEQRRITELGNSVFDSLDKDKILYIDLSGTDIKDMTVNRSSGLFDGFGQNTLFYLPASNDNGGEDNVVIGDNCARLYLTDKMDFRAHKDFNADSAVLDCGFEVNETATVLLPFALAKEQADAIGNFHTLKEINGTNAIFNEAETNGTKANTPYVFLPTVTKIEAQNVSIEGIEDDGLDETNPSIVMQGNMAGTYEKLALSSWPTDVYALTAAGTEGTVAGYFDLVDAGATIPPFRAFIQAGDIAASSLTIVVGEKPTTSLSPLNSILSTRSSKPWYTISGQQFQGRPDVKGLYIHNGRKINIR